MSADIIRGNTVGNFGAKIECLVKAQGVNYLMYSCSLMSWPGCKTWSKCLCLTLKEKPSIQYFCLNPYSK